MPVLKVNVNGEWKDIASTYSHSHTVSDITDLPASLVDDIEALKDKVGANSVAYQVNTAIEANTYQHPATHPANMITGLASVATSGDYNDLANKPSIPSIDGLATVEYVNEKVATMGGGSSGGNGSGGSGGVSSWNDLTDKPFGEVRSTIVDCTFETTEGASEAAYQDNSNATLIIGETYTVMWDGVEYTCECVEYSTLPCIGNTVVSGGENNNIPFAIGRDIDGSMMGMPCWYAMILVPNDSGVYNCTISGNAIKKIDMKYIYQPDWNNTDKLSGSCILNRPFGDLPTGTVIVPETVVNIAANLGTEYGYMFIPTANIMLGVSYSVEFDGNIYTITGANESDGFVENMAVLKYKDDTVDFTIAENFYDSGMSAINTKIGEHTFKVTLAEDVVKKIDAKYLPEMSSGSNGGVSSWNDLTDKPFYEEEGVATIMAEQDITEFANNQGYGVPSRGFNFGEDMDAFTLEPGVEYTVMWDGNSYPVQLQDISAMMGAEAYALGNAAAFDPSFSGNNEPFLIGWNIVGIVILVVDGSTKTTHKVGISQYGQIVKTLDAKYLPMEAIDERIEAYISAALEGEF